MEVMRMRGSRAGPGDQAALKLVEAVDGQFDRCVIAGDSMSSLMAVRRPGVNYKPYFQNRVSEIQKNLAALDEKVRVLEPLQKIAGSLNPADIATRGRASLSDVDAQSEWQNGPPFLRLMREDWPMQLPEEVPGAIPPTELRKASVQEVHLASTSSSLLEAIQQLQARSNSLDRVVGRLALGLRKGRVPSAAPITAPERDAALRLLFFEAQGKVRKKMSEGEYPGSLPLSSGGCG